MDPCLFWHNDGSLLVHHADDLLLATPRPTSEAWGDMAKFMKLKVSPDLDDQWKPYLGRLWLRDVANGLWKLR